MIFDDFYLADFTWNQFCRIAMFSRKIWVAEQFFNFFTKYVIMILQCIARCGNFRIFLPPLIFYVISILTKCRVSKNGILTILEALNFNFVTFSSLTKCKNSLKPNFRGVDCWSCQNSRFWDSRLTKLDFT